MREQQKLTLRLPPSTLDRNYDIVIGEALLASLGQRLADLTTSRQAAIVTNTTVAPLYLEKVVAGLNQVGFHSLPIILPDGEEYKNAASLQQIFDALIGHRYERSSLIIALGGGVIGDMAGYAAASFLRGVDYVQVPTTLLAQVDSSVGGKTGINHPLGKNLIGAFYQPRLVLIDTATLATLPRRQLQAGIAEIIKYGVIDDSNLFVLLENHIAGLLALDSALVAQIIATSCAIKARIVGHDEKESGQRALLNFGHTFGHAIETLTGYTTFLHGEAVALGMIMAADLSCRLGLCPQEDLLRLQQLVARSGLPTIPPALAQEAYLDAMARDKKVVGGKMRFVVMDKIGQSHIRSNIAIENIVATIQNVR